MATKTHQQTPIFFNKSVSGYVSFSVYSNETKKMLVFHWNKRIKKSTANAVLFIKLFEFVIISVSAVAVEQSHDNLAYHHEQRLSLCILT